MGNHSDFVIQNGVLRKYSGRGGDVVIPEGVTSIAERAFQKNNSLRTIHIPEGVTSIGDDAFYECENLTEAYIPGSVQHLGEWIFRDCYRLNHVVFGAGVKKIGKGMFRDCRNLVRVDIPDTVTQIGFQAFCNCEDLSHIVIPNGVTQIGEDAFYQCKSMVNTDGFLIIDNVLWVYNGHSSKVVIPNGVTVIGDAAFSECKKVSEVVIPDTVEYIGDSAFNDCANLKTINIPSSVTSIGSMAFNDCYSLSAISIPGGVKTIGYGAFCDCTGLAEIEFHEGLSTVGSWAFRRCKLLTSVIIPNTVTKIDESAFEECSGLEDIVLPENISSIYSETFSGCRKLQNIIIPDGVTHIGDKAFSNCSGLASIVIPSSVTTLGDYAFDSCHSLEYLLIAGGKTIIKVNTFGRTLPTGLIEHLDSAYSGMTDAALKKYVLDKAVWSEVPSNIQAEIYLTRQGKPLLSCYESCVNDPGNLGEAILERMGAISAENELNAAATFMVTFHKNVDCDLLCRMYECIKQKQAARTALKIISDCQSLMITLRTGSASSDSTMQISAVSNSGQQEIDALFGQIKGLQETLVGFFAKLPLTSIDSNSCDLLKNSINALQSDLTAYLSWLNQPENNSAMMDVFKAFMEEKLAKSPEQAVVDLCNDLRFVVESLSVYKDLNEYNSIQSAINAPFAQHLPAETRKELSASLQRVVERLHGKGITNDWLSSHMSVASTGSLAVKNICPVSNIAYKKIKGGIRIDGVDATGDVILPDFIDDLPVIRIGQDAFSKRKDITSIKLPQYLIEIEPNAFSFCVITTICIPESVETLGEKAFFSCKHLESISLSKNMKHIKARVFEKCEMLKTIAIPVGTTYIGDMAFNQCANLKSIQIPASVSRLGYGFVPKNTVIFCGNGTRASRYVDENYGYKKFPYDWYQQELDAQEKDYFDT